jgi:hypothetical protein
MMTMIKEFSEALETADIIAELMQDAVTAETDAEAGTLTFEGHTVHLQENGPQRVTAGVGLIYSGDSPTEAVIEAVTAAVAQRTREILRVALRQ